MLCSADSWLKLIKICRNNLYITFGSWKGRRLNWAFAKYDMDHGKQSGLSTEAGYRRFTAGYFTIDRRL